MRELRAKSDEGVEGQKPSEKAGALSTHKWLARETRDESQEHAQETRARTNGTQGRHAHVTTKRQASRHCK